MHKIKKIILKLIFLLIDSVRPLIGPEKACIYPISCTSYTKGIFHTQPLYKAIPLVAFRLLSCNPLTAIFWKIRNLFHKKV